MSHTLVVAGESLICLGLALLIVTSFANLFGPDFRKILGKCLGKWCLNRAGAGFEFEELTPTERRLYVLDALLRSRPGRLIGPAGVLKILGAKTRRRNRERGRNPSLLITATPGYGTGYGPGYGAKYDTGYGLDDEPSAALSVESRENPSSPSITRDRHEEAFWFVVLERHTEKESAESFHSQREMALVAFNQARASTRTFGKSVDQGETIPGHDDS